MIQKFEFCNTDFEGAYLIKPFCATDVRGAFIKDYSKEVFEANGLEHNLAEVFYRQSWYGALKARFLMLSLTSAPNHLHSKNGRASVFPKKI